MHDDVPCNLNIQLTFFFIPITNNAFYPAVRYYGKSKPFNGHLKGRMGYLTTEQAMGDYAELITELKAQYDAADSPVIGFGGSYGGMLAAWFRMKYPHMLDGAIAGSAPIWNFFGEVRRAALPLGAATTATMYQFKYCLKF